MQKFNARAYEISGEMLHVFGLMLKLSDLSISPFSRAQTVEQCKIYIDDLRAADRLEPPDADLSAFDNDNHAQLMFVQRDSDEFRDIAAYLMEQRELSERDRYGGRARSLSDLLQNDATEFVRQISLTHGSYGKFARTPLLARLDADAFAEQLIGLDPLMLREVMFGLAGRYDDQALEGPLREEASWLVDLQDRLLTRAAELKSFSRDRVVGLSDGTLGPIVERIALRRAERERQDADAADVAGSQGDGARRF